MVHLSQLDWQRLLAAAERPVAAPLVGAEPGLVGQLGSMVAAHFVMTVVEPEDQPVVGPGGAALLMPVQHLLNTIRTFMCRTSGRLYWLSPIRCID